MSGRESPRPSTTGGRESMGGGGYSGHGAAGGAPSGAHRDHNRRHSAGGGNPRLSQSSRCDFGQMGIETLTKELATLSADMERDIGKVYRKYERLERSIRAERDRKIAELHARQSSTLEAGAAVVVGAKMTRSQPDSPTPR